MNLNQYRQKLEQKKGQRNQIKKDLEKTKEQIKHLKKEIVISEKAQVIMQIVAKKTQEELEYRLAELVSLCLESVFKNPYKFAVNFETRRGKTECDLRFSRNNKLLKPTESSGVGAVDIAAFGLRPAVWSLSKPKSRDFFGLDEPFKHLKGIEANRKAIQMVKQLSEELDLQILMVSDERVPIEEIEKGADKIFEVNLKDGVSIVKVR